MIERPDGNRLQTTLVAIAVVVGLVVALPLLVVFALVGIPWWLSIVLGGTIGVLAVLRILRSADRRVLAPFSPTETDQVSMARYENLIEGLALSIGTPEPELLVIHDDALNALAVSCRGRQTIVVTDALLRGLERIELEGVTAELLVRLKSGDAEMATTMAALVGQPLVDSPLRPVTGGLASALLRRHLDEHRDVLADQQAVTVTRYPPGLSAALDRMASGPSTPAAATAGTDHLWMVPPPRRQAVVPHAPLDWRIEILLEI